MSVFEDTLDEEGEVTKSAEDNRKEFVEYITKGIGESFTSLQGRHKKLDKWRRYREGISEVAVKNTPFPDASNVVTPFTMWLAQTAYAEMQNTFAVRDPFWMVKAMYKNEELQENARVLSNYFNVISKSPTDLNLKDKNAEMHYEADTLGTCYVKYPYVKKYWQYMGEDVGAGEEPVTVTAHDGLDVVVYQEEDVYFPSGAKDPQDSPWWAFIDHYHKHDLQMLGENGIFLNTDEVLESGIGDVNYMNENHIKDAERLGIVFDENGLYDVAEVYAFWDVNNDDKPEDIIVTIHLSSGTVLREEFNKIGRRPFGVMKYMFVPKQIPGRGVCQMAEHMQDEMDTTHNMRIDNNKFANQNVLQVKRGSDIKVNETVSPGKMFFVDNIGDIAPLSLGKMEYASINEENLASTYARQATGISEIMAGQPDSTLKSRDTFGGQQLRLSQGKGMFSAIVDNKISFYNEMGLIMFYQLIHHKDDVMEKEKSLQRFPEGDLEILERALDIPINQIPLKLQFAVRTRHLDETKDVQRNNLLMYQQLLTQYVTQGVQAAQALESGQIQGLAYDILHKGLLGSTKIMETLLDLLSIEDTDDFLVDSDVMEQQEEARKMQQIMQQMMQTNQGMQGAGVSQQGGMNENGNRQQPGTSGANPGAGQGAPGPATA